jgi:hypothetical protein
VSRLTRATSPARPRRPPLRAGLIAAGSAVLLWRIFAASPVRDDGSPGREVAALRAELTAVKRATAMGRPAEQDRHALEAESRQRIRAQAEVTERALQAESVDLRWSTDARRLILVAAGVLAATSVTDVECRATLCRMRVSHEDESARAAFERDFPPAVAELLPQLMVDSLETDGGPPGQVLYLGRDGHDLPAAGSMSAVR